MKKILCFSLLSFSFYVNAQCSISFNDLLKMLRSNETTLNYSLENKGYNYNYQESAFFCGKYLYYFKRYYEGKAVAIEYLMPNSRYEIESLISDAKKYGMNLTDSTINPSTGMPNNIYEGGIGHLMLQISSNERSHLITIYGLLGDY
jgi:hypothetical protein